MHKPLCQRIRRSLLPSTVACAVLLLCSSVLGQQLAVLPSAGNMLGAATAPEPGKWIVFATGFMPIQPTLVDGGRTILWEGKAGTYAVIYLPPGDGQPVVQQVVLGDAPPPPPPPGPDVNPYRPAPAFQAAVQPVRAFSLSQADSLALSEVYSSVASQARAGVFQNLGQVRASIVKLGTPLNLKGRYAGLSLAVEQYLTTTLGLEEPVPAERVGDALETIAWAVFEAGRAK